MHKLLSRSIAVLALASLAACGGGGGGGGGGAQTFFLIASSTPPTNGLGVPLEAVVTVRFNSRLNTGTINAQSLVITPFAGGDPIAGHTVLVDDGSDLSVRWTATELLSEDSHYLCTVDNGLRASDGSVLAPPQSFRFSTTPDPTQLDMPVQGDLLPLLNRMNKGRQAHEAILLDNGHVLITGGYTIGLSITDSAETFNPITGAFTELTGKMSQARAGHTMTPLSGGQILICGGYIPGAPGQVATTATAEIYHTSSGAFTPVGDMTSERADHAAVPLPDGTVLITGGSRLVGGFLQDLATAEIYDPTTGTFSAHPNPMVHTRSTHGMVEVGIGKYVLGGGSDVDFSSSVFSTITNAFQSIGQGAQDKARFGAMMESFKSGAAVIAGGDTVGTVMFIPATHTFVQNTGSALRYPRAYGTATRIGDDRIFIVGGLDFSRGGFIEASCDVIFEGGLGGSRTFATEVRFPTGMAYHTATTLNDGRVLFCGGLNVNGSLPNLDTAFLLNP